MKILLISHRFAPFLGGIEVISELLANAFTRAGHTVTVMTFSAAGSAQAFPFRVVRNPGIIRMMSEHARCDVVLENNPCLRLAWPKIFFGRPSVVSLQTWISRTNGAITARDRFKQRFWLKQAGTVISASKALRDRCWPMSQVIPNPYRSEEFKVLMPVQRRNDFVFLGRLVSDKGADLAIRAIHEMTRDAFTASPHLTIIGEGPERQKLEMLTESLGCRDRIRFAGPLRGQALVTALNEHQFMLVPSLWEEPFGVVALEGIACGCIPIVSDGGGLPEAIGKAGLVFQRGNLQSLIDCMRYVAGDEQTAKRLQFEATAQLNAHNEATIAGMYLQAIENINS
jgi:glycosyltransferase involved in cell wall biosynthesis